MNPSRMKFFISISHSFRKHFKHETFFWYLHCPNCDLNCYNYCHTTPYKQNVRKVLTLIACWHNLNMKKHAHKITIMNYICSSRPSVDILATLFDKQYGNGERVGEHNVGKIEEKLDPVGSTVRYEMMKLCTGSV